MNLIQNYTAINAPLFVNIVNKKNKVHFTSEPMTTVANNSIDTIQNVTSDYNVSAPMNYNFIKDLKISDNLTAKCYKLANGQNVIIVPKDGTTVVKTYVNTGSFNEPDNLRGISHFIEHNLFNGSEDLGDKVFFDEVNKMGANTNASTSFSVTDYFISSNLLDDKDLENKIKLHAGMIQSPKFLLEKLNKEKNIVNSEINMCLSEDENIGYTETIKNLFNIKSSSLDLVAGSTDNITALTRDNVVNYFNNNYYPANMTTVITGEVDPDDTMKLISKYFTSKKTPVQNRHFEQMKPIDKPVRKDIISQKSTGGASIFLGFAGPENSNSKDKIYMNALSTLLVDLLNSKLSSIERKYSTEIGIQSERLSPRPDDKGMILFESNVKDDYTEIFLKELYAKLTELQNKPITNDELSAIKNNMKKNHQQWLECSHALNQALGQSFLDNRVDYLNEYNDIVDNMTVEDIANTAKKYLDLNKVALTVVHPSNSEPEKINNNYNSAKTVSFTGINKKTPINLDKVSEYKLQNNFDVILNDTNSDIVEYRFNLGKNIWTPKKAAVADVLSQMLQYGGTEKHNLSEISAMFDTLGADTGVGAGESGIYLSSSFPTENTQKAMNLFFEKLQTPDLSEETFKQALQRCDDFYSTEEVSAFDKFDKAMYNGTSYAITTKEKQESLSKITLDDVKAFYRDIFENGQGQVVVSGDFSKNVDLKNIIFNEISKFAPVQPKDISVEDKYTPIKQTEVYTAEYKKNQAQIIEGFRFKYNKNIKDAVCLQLLSDILGGSPSSRLFSDLREQRHLAYHVSSNFDVAENIGVMSLFIGTTTENQETGEQTFDNIKKSIDGFNENIDKLMKEPVSVEELDAAKKALKTSILSPTEMTSVKTSILESASRNPYGLDIVNKKLELIDKITPEDILNTARNVFSSKPIYSVAATKASLDANKNYLDSLLTA